VRSALTLLSTCRGLFLIKTTHLSSSGVLSFRFGDLSDQITTSSADLKSEMKSEMKATKDEIIQEFQQSRAMPDTTPIKEPPEVLRLETKLELVREPLN